MARSRTTLVAGNQLALTHGAQSDAAISERLPAKLAELRESIPYLIDVDRDVLVTNLARVLVQLDLLDAYYERVGGIIDNRGRPRGSWKLWSSLHHQAREYSKMLALGPSERARTIQAMAGAAVDADAVRAAQSRLRERHLQSTTNFIKTGS